jgi:Cys-tRNA(Pro)/Cys-tRNA(Cys) deacylase
MDTKKIADHLNWGGCEVATEEELSRLTGFPKYGVSPIGLGEISVIMENSLLFFETILIGAGQEALEIEISPRYLAQLINPQMAKIQLD